MRGAHVVQRVCADLRKIEGGRHLEGSSAAFECELRLCRKHRAARRLAQDPRLFLRGRQRIYELERAGEQPIRLVAIGAVPRSFACERESARRLGYVDGEELLRRVDYRAAVVPSGDEFRTRNPELQAGAIAIVDRPHCKRRRVVVRRRTERVERRSAIPGPAKREPRSVLKLLLRCTSRRREQLERTAVVMGDQLGVIIRPAEGLDPLDCADVLVGARRTGDLPVRDFTHEHVPKRILELPGDSRPTLTADEALAIERV